MRGILPASLRHRLLVPFRCSATGCPSSLSLSFFPFPEAASSEGPRVMEPLRLTDDDDFLALSPRDPSSTRQRLGAPNRPRVQRNFRGDRNRRQRTHVSHGVGTTEFQPAAAPSLYSHLARTGAAGGTTFRSTTPCRLPILLRFRGTTVRANCGGKRRKRALPLFTEADRLSGKKISIKKKKFNENQQGGLSHLPIFTKLAYSRPPSAALIVKKKRPKRKQNPFFFK